MSPIEREMLDFDAMNAAVKIGRAVARPRYMVEVSR